MAVTMAELEARAARAGKLRARGRELAAAPPDADYCERVLALYDGIEAQLMREEFDPLGGGAEGIEHYPISSPPRVVHDAPTPDFAFPPRGGEGQGGVAASRCATGNMVDRSDRRHG